MRTKNFGLLIFLILGFQLNTVSSVQTNNLDINESFVIESHSYVTFNFTNTKDSFYFINQTATDPIELLVVNESNLIRFKNKESFYEVNIISIFTNDGLMLWFNETETYRMNLENYFWSFRINYIGEIIILLHNTNNFDVSGYISLKRLVFESDVQNNTVIKTVIQNNTITKIITVIQNNTVIITELDTESTGKSNNNTNGFLFLSVSLMLLVLRKRK